MGCVTSCGLKLLLQIFNAILFVAFIILALFEILLKYSKSILQQLLSRIFDQFNIGDEDLRQLARFTTEYTDGIAVILVVVGLTLKACCLIECIVSCYGCNIPLRIYATILIVLLVAQIVVVYVVFSYPTRFTSLIVSSLETLFQCYDEKR
ncbi:tetraspanin [Echinococcus multilocularis]|uniref:Tetraspanin n=1 Tax=Echinococcus multilocularis TaxID=6211 RepID=A0A0S4MR16_ECHMU|nr:tetraspanin [Echinococcus multilocularis]